MTLKEFFNIARQAKWFFNSEGSLRTRSLPDGRDYVGELCPLAYVTLAVNDKPNWTSESARESRFEIDVPNALYRPFSRSSSTDLIERVISGADHASFGGKRNQDRRWLARGLGIWKR